MLRMLRRKDKGFTLIELMIVIAIIGILAAIAIPQFTQYRQRGYNAEMQADIRNAATANEAFYSDSLSYAGATSDLSSRGYTPSAGVTVTVAGNSTGYSISASHVSGTKTWSLTGPGGTIQ